ncbi:MAG: hypothetical protein ACE5R4_11685 [Armatimonadota bacterium]
MGTKWHIRKIRDRVCGHGLDVVSFDLEFEHDGRQYSTELDYHVADLLTMGDDLAASVRHLVDVHVAHTINVMAAKEKIHEAEGAQGEIESIAEVLTGHVGGSAEDHPLAHAPADESE